MTSSLPSLIWTAISYKDQFYTRTNYKTEADETQGDAEIAILKLQKSLPDMPHLMTLPVTYKMRRWDILSPPKQGRYVHEDGYRIPARHLPCDGSHL